MKTRRLSQFDVDVERHRQFTICHNAQHVWYLEFDLVEMMSWNLAGAVIEMLARALDYAEVNWQDREFSRSFLAEARRTFFSAQGTRSIGSALCGAAAWPPKRISSQTQQNGRLEALSTALFHSLKSALHLIPTKTNVFCAHSILETNSRSSSIPRRDSAPTLATTSSHHHHHHNIPSIENIPPSRIVFPFRIITFRSFDFINCSS